MADLTVSGEEKLINTTRNTYLIFTDLVRQRVVFMNC